MMAQEFKLYSKMTKHGPVNGAKKITSRSFSKLCKMQMSSWCLRSEYIEQAEMNTCTSEALKYLQQGLD